MDILLAIALMVLIVFGWALHAFAGLKKEYPDLDAEQILNQIKAKNRELDSTVKVKYRHKHKKPAFYGLCGLKRDCFEKTYVLNANYNYEDELGDEVYHGTSAVIFDHNLFERYLYGDIDIQVLNKKNEWVDFVLADLEAKFEDIERRSFIDG
ncbi:MAG: hypothetical protein GY941_26265 [Planctomycetes bacterium]|nr:hypothetical protein [Planctomycetota bacterium]